MVDGVISGKLPRPFGKYSLVRELGRGAMGAVYEARDSALDRRVALKLMLPTDHVDPNEAKIEEALFTREAQLCAGLAKHPNIVSVYEAGTIEGRRYIAMEYIDGIPMSDWVNQRRPSLRGRIRVLRDIAYAVHHAHQNEILHRDLKPKNVLIDAQGRSYVTDFGMAKRAGADGSGASSSSGSGTVVGTPSYMSPEQAQGLKKIDRRTDVYALGAMLYEVLTDKPPFPGEMTIVALMRVVQDPIPPPSQASPAWAQSTEDKSIEAICMKALSKNPDDRFPNAQVFGEALANWLGDKSPTQVPIRAAEPKKKSQVSWIPAALIPVAVLIAFFAMRMSSGPSPFEADWSAAAKVLPYVEPAKDAVEGTWKNDSGLVSTRAAHARCEIPWKAPEEYDVRAVFVRKEGVDEVAILLPWKGATFLWTIRALENNVPNTAVFRVRKDGIAAIVKSDRVASSSTFAVPNPPGASWSLRNPAVAGVGCVDGVVEFQSFEIMDISGKGERSR